MINTTLLNTAHLLHYDWMKQTNKQKTPANMQLNISLLNCVLQSQSRSNLSNKLLCHSEEFKLLMREKNKNRRKFESQPKWTFQLAKADWTEISPKKMKSGNPQWIHHEWRFDKRCRSIVQTQFAVEPIVKSIHIV